jgi:hypothetical protein
MAGTSSHNYKSYARGSRKIVNVGAFTGGMQYVDSPLPDGFSKVLLNFIQKDFGNNIRPRGGWRNYANDLAIGSNNLYAHHSGISYVKDLVTNKLLLRRYILLLAQNGSSKYALFNSTSKLIIEEVYDGTEDTSINGELVLSTLVTGGAAVNTEVSHRTYFTNQVHDMLLEDPTPVGIAAELNGNVYIPGKNGTLWRLEIYKAADGTYTHNAVAVVPKVVTPSQAVNLGYNMLLSTPYAFDNRNTGFLNLQGILPYAEDGTTLKMQAELGEKIVFKLVYDYNASATYKVRWELRDIVRDTVDVLQTQQASPSYTNGAAITLAISPTYKQFSLAATVFASTDLVNPIQVMFLPAYNLVDASKKAKTVQQNFDITECLGMLVYKEQIVAWGIEDAEMSLCFSAVNDPTYFPFPNNIVTFDSKILGCVQHLDSLIIATETTIYQVDMTVDGYIKKPVQGNLKLRTDDTIAMHSVRNMLHFKSGNSYFMMVPNTKLGKGELQVAPISTPIDRFLNNFKSSCWDLILDGYDVSRLIGVSADSVTIHLTNYSSYPYGNAIHNIYKLELAGLQGGSRYLDVHLVYDTMFRAWTMEIVEATRAPFHPFSILATGTYQFLNIATAANSAQTAQWLRLDEIHILDDFALDLGLTRLFKNHQLLDTGKPDIDGNKKKRMRHVVLEFNNLSKEDIRFRYINYLDDQIRAGGYRYTIEHDIDPGSPTYGQIYVERVLDDSNEIVVYGESTLDDWSLGNSQFPEQTVIKMHIDVSGKGYYPRLKLALNPESAYEINTLSWAYRDMYAR